MDYEVEMKTNVDYEVEMKNRLKQITYVWALLDKNVKLASFFERWVIEMPHERKKELSYSGALVHLPPTEWTPYDPGNHVYSIALRIMFNNDAAFLSLGWSSETCGDVIESILGYSWKAEHEPRQVKITSTNKLRLHRFVLMIEQLCMAIVLHGHATAWRKWYDFDEWRRTWMN